MALRQREDRRVEGAADGAGQRLRVALGDEVPVGQGPPEQHVAHGPADQPGAGIVDDAGHLGPRGLEAGVHQRASRSVRAGDAPIPQVTS